MKAWTIIGYTFDADIYCAGVCVIQALGYTAPSDGMEPTISAELDRIAEERGINREDEHSFDSGDFPKVIFASEEFPDYATHCGGCGGILGGFDAADYHGKTSGN